MSVYSTAKSTAATGRNQNTPEITTKPIQMRKFPMYNGFRAQPKMP